MPKKPAAPVSAKAPVHNTGAASLNIVEFGAVGDGKMLCTDAVNKAIATAAQRGISHVIVPPGDYVCGTILLTSNITFEIQNGATVTASENIKDFPEEEKKFGGRHLFSAKNEHHITICGTGTIEGNNKAFTDNYDKTPAYTWTSCKKDRPCPLLDFRDCSDIRISDITIRNSPGWTCHLWQCDMVWIRGVRMHSSVYAGNSDGFDLVGCRDVMISDCSIETGDDAIVLKTPRGTRSCERITITNCVIRTNCAAFRLGAESWHDFRNITISNSVVHQSSRGIDITSQDGAIIEDVAVSNITIDTNSGINMNRPIHLELRKGRGEWGDSMPLDDMVLGKIRRISIANVILKTDGRILLTAADGGMLENILLRDITVTIPWIEDPVSVDKLSDPLQSSNYNPMARLARAAVVVENAENFQLYGLIIQWPRDTRPGDDFLPKYEKGGLVVDPRTTEKEPPRFHAVWGCNLQGGILDIPLANSSDPKAESIHLEKSTIKNPARIRRAL